MHANQKCLNPTSKNSVHRAEVVSPGRGESENIIGTVIMFICFLFNYGNIFQTNFSLIKTGKLRTNWEILKFGLNGSSMSVLRGQVSWKVVGAPQTQRRWLVSRWLIRDKSWLVRGREDSRHRRSWCFALGEKNLLLLV